MDNLVEGGIIDGDDKISKKQKNRLKNKRGKCQGNSV
jgi:hypothetical protein